MVVDEAQRAELWAVQVRRLAAAELGPNGSHDQWYGIQQQVCSGAGRDRLG